MRTARSLPYGGEVSVRGGGFCQGDPLPFGQTDTCEIIILPQTSFAGGNKISCNSWFHQDATWLQGAIRADVSLDHTVEGQCALVRLVNIEFVSLKR